MTTTNPGNASNLTHLYRHFASDGTLLYVGISLSALHRLRGHQDHSHWFNRIARVDIEQFPTREEALKAERAAILAEHPAHSIKCRRDLKAEQAAARAAKAGSQATKAALSRDGLASQIVEFNVYYDETKIPLPLRRGQIRKYMDEGRLGYFELPNATGTKLKQYVTGWQLIDFVEWLQSREKPAPNVTALGGE